MGIDRFVLEISNSPSKTDQQDPGFHMRTGRAHRSYYALRAALSSMVDNARRSSSSLTKVTAEGNQGHRYDTFREARFK